MHTALWIALLAGSGCELVADFDRSRIPSGRPDSGVPPSPPPEDDAGADDAGVADADAAG